MGRDGIAADRVSVSPEPDKSKDKGKAMTVIKHWTILWLALLVVGLGGVPPSWAAGEPGTVSVEASPSTPTKAQPDASAVPSETVSRFVSAYLEVVKLIESREPNLQSAETETESIQMQQEIQAEAVTLIQSHDLTLPAYWELLGLANSDPEFRERVLAQMEEASL